MPIVSLDLGCGATPRNTFNADVAYGIDVRDDADAKVVRADLVLERIPFEDSFFDFVEAHDFLEHMPRLIYAPQRRYPFVELMNEIWRVLKPGGRFLSVTPAFPHPAAFFDPTHVNYITAETFPMYFDGVKRRASIYGFNGAFFVKNQHWRGQHLVSSLIKIEPGQTADPPGPE
jgi:SAM-dependent methyltransferase